MNYMSNSIFTVTCLDPSLLEDINGKHCVGYYFDLEEALTTIINPHFEWLSEGGYYRHMVIEECHPGIANVSDRKEFWFRIDKKGKSWIKCRKPAKFRNTCAFGIG